jgi:hypothetical protein
LILIFIDFQAFTLRPFHFQLLIWFSLDFLFLFHFV